ncbi:hypothetical protein E4K66_07955 [Bradyrhizobium frederickii]|uniref:Uncharacterized protein n=1 Tax=Bradyrhizobium frederickii TaxID=2560054 RepID=A0A4Y9LDJ8_9BRAD|nr:DUF5677 domain-containing protein [Bradyrhizobium frederickii]TFV40767.1 hypothetical protein E4K66_07955 [Bradyrhizobium frederickii]
MTPAQKSLQQLIGQQLTELQHRLVEGLIGEKLGTLGIHGKDLHAKLLEQVLKGNNEALIWEDGSTESRNIAISFSKDDMARIKLEIDGFIQHEIPSIVGKASEDAANDLLASLKESWPEQQAWEEALVVNFRENLEIRWGKGLNLLRMLLSICREIGQENVRKHRRSKRRRNSALSDVLIRLHARSCQVSGEVIALLENGFADGAMARWRTLHEIGVVAAVLSDFGEEAAERYVAHQAIEVKAAMDEHIRSHGASGSQLIAKRLSTKINRDFEDALKTYGREFASPYGWAAKDLNKKKPIFPDLETAAGRAVMRFNYKIASYNVHASARGVFFRLSELDASGIVAGASNAGLTEPAQNTASALTLVTMLLLGPRWTLEDIVALRVLSKIRDEIPAVFSRAERKLQRDDARHRKRLRDSGKPSRKTGQRKT